MQPPITASRNPYKELLLKVKLSGPIPVEKCPGSGGSAMPATETTSNLSSNIIPGNQGGGGIILFGPIRVLTGGHLQAVEQVCNGLPYFIIKISIVQ